MRGNATHIEHPPTPRLAGLRRTGSDHLQNRFFVGEQSAQRQSFSWTAERVCLEMVFERLANQARIQRHVDGFLK